MERCKEIRQLLKLSPLQVKAKAGDHLRVMDDLDMLHRIFAEDMTELIRINNANGQETNIIVPVGPTGQYPYIVDIVRTEGLPLDSCRFFFMDEYCDDEGRALTKEHPLSFKAIAQKKFIKPLRDIDALKEEQVYFPDESNLDRLEELTDDIGPLDACFGGIGIHGHVAFNEPEDGVSRMGYRKVKLNDYTVTINAIRAGVGGNLECFPTKALTVGMKQILSCKKIMLYCRNGTSFDWANTILRVALLGKPGDDYPVTHIRDGNYVITTDRDTLRAPINLI